MKNPNEPQHKTRDHRFAYISTGDITPWARGTSRFRYPEPKNKRPEPTHITSKAACAMRPIKRENVVEFCCIVAPSEGAKTVRQEMEACDRRADAIDAGLAISNLMNRRFGLVA